MYGSSAIAGYRVGSTNLRHTNGEMDREAYTLQGDRRLTDQELERMNAGDEDIRKNFHGLQQMKRRNSYHPDMKAQRADGICLPTYGRIRPDEKDQIEQQAAAAPGDEEDQPSLGPASTSMFGHRLDLHLDEITNPKVRAIFDPTNFDDLGSISSTLSWTPEELDKMLAEMRPEHMAVLIRKRIHEHKQQPAKRLSFHHLQYFEHGQHIIKDCSGFIEPGEMVGVSGGPDSGVTALLGLLAGRLQPNTPSGQPNEQIELPGIPKSDVGPGFVLLDGRKPSADFAAQVGYAVKADVHLPYLTVEETLYFSARLRLHRSLPDRVIRFRVRAMMKLLGLSHVANTQVGDAMVRGVSGGEKRRVG